MQSPSPTMSFTISSEVCTSAFRQSHQHAQAHRSLFQPSSNHYQHAPLSKERSAFSLSLNYNDGSEMCNGLYNNNDNNAPQDQQRRNILQTTTTSLAAATLLSTITTSPLPANAAQTAGESIRKSAANIPGYGQPDIYFPPYFLGKWKATREIVVSDDVFLQNIVPIVVTYDLRFIPVDGDSSTSPDKVVMDRGYNEASFQTALLSALSNGDNKLTSLPPAIQSYDWSSSNPNVLTLSYADGTGKEIKVTKRAATIGPDGETLSSSEYRRVSDVGVRGIPVLSASRILTKWRKGDAAESVVVEGIEIIYSEGVMGDPMGGGGPNGGAGPKVSSKSRIRLERL